MFGGFIAGRQLELMRTSGWSRRGAPSGWKPGTYWIARFELMDQGASCKLVFDHTGFPAGEAQHLADGWKVNYWQPMTKVLG